MGKNRIGLCDWVSGPPAASQEHMARLSTLHQVRDLAHDLRHMAQAIVGAADTLEIAVQERNWELRRRLLRRLEESSAQAVKMLRHVLMEPRLTPKPSERAEVGAAVSRVLNALAPLAGKKSAKIRCRMTTPLVAVISRTHLERLLLNVLLNAIEAGGEAQPQIRVWTRAVSKTWVCIAIRDNGRGMSVGQSAPASNPGRARVEERIGRGLGIVKNILEVNEGFLRIRSRPGKGTKLTIWLPHGQRGHTSHVHHAN